ncbi:hypothetical protein PHJA_001164100 [Phtheirospermum japonicum]|uniref:Uncharacterized protein n=1 Tax=Phtheirospermum japonicum TaxID=374723 RepID=A0A830BW39_9LAMI|nr:hypothetical protein PHJA_001164100 [Phtheirospermum japonicum]
MQWVIGRQPTMTWKFFAYELLRHNGDNPIASPYESLAATTQTASLEYVDAFISWMAHVPNLTDDHYLGLFLDGLQADIRTRLLSKDTTDLFATIQLACKIERFMVLSGRSATSGQ